MQRAFEKSKEKIKVTSLEIIVTGTKDKPYFEIKYKEVGKEYYRIGYSSYDLNNVLRWKEECFEIVNQVASEYGGGWIPVSSGKLPEVPEGKDYVDVLITKQYTSSAEVIPAEYYEEDGFNDYEKSLITAWRYDYMPEPYKAESEE